MNGEPDETTPAALTAYLFGGDTLSNRHLVAASENRPINSARPLIIGSKPIDGGHYILGPDEVDDIRSKDATAFKYLRPYVGGWEFINRTTRFIFALQKAAPADVNSSPILKERVAAVRAIRLASASAPTQALANTPQSFHVNVLPTASFLVVPKVSSERREYVPIGWLEPPVIPSELLFVLADADLFDFGLLTSKVHMAWLGHIGGRLKSDFRYSIGQVYNTFPWPDASEKQTTEIETLAQAVLDARAKWPTSSLADLYDPDTMPANLRKAHAALDTAVDRLYRKKPFDSDRDRVEHLFGLYEKLVNPIEADAEKQNKRINRKVAKKF